MSATSNLILQTGSSSNTYIKRNSSDTSIPNIIKARDTAKRVLEKASRVSMRGTSPKRMSSHTLNTTASHDSSSSPPSTCIYNSPTDTIHVAAHPDFKPRPSSTDILSAVVPVVIQEGWLSANDVARYEMTCKSASFDASIWKAYALFRQHLSQGSSYWPFDRYGKIESDSSNIMELFLSPVGEIWFMVATISSSCFVPIIFVGPEKSWMVWAVIYFTVLGMVLVEGVVLVAIRCLYCARRAVRHFV